MNDPSASDLDLSYFDLKDLPDIFQYRELSTRLETLDLSGNQLVALPSEIGDLQALQTLMLADNQLIALPPEIGSLQALEILDISGNQLTILPKEIGSLQALQILDVSDNRLTALPKEIGNLRALQTLTLYSNQLTVLPKEIGNLHALQTLMLYNNQLSALPPEIGNLQALRILDIYGNRLTVLPKEIGNLRTLETLGLSRNQLIVLPPEIGNLQSLETLELSRNRLTVLPKEIGGLRALQTLLLSRNRLTTLPKEISGLQALRILKLSRNQLTVLLPEIGSLQALQTLMLSGNRLIALPPEIGGLQALQALELWDNQLASLPREIGNLQALHALELYNNQLAGLPQEVLNLPHACEVELTNSGLSPAVIERLRDAVTVPGYQGPRISFSMQGHGETDDEKTIQESLAELFATTKKPPREFPNLEREPAKAASLRSWLSRLSLMRDYKREGNLNDAVANKILGYLTLAEEDENFRNTFFNVIEGAAATCGDRMALSVLHLGIAHRRTIIDLTNMQDLAKFLIRGPWAIEQLETIAREKIPQLTFFDEIEVYLGYPIQLKNRLKLQIDVDEMLYFRCSALTPEDLNNAECFIKAQLNTEDGPHNILVEDDTWVKALTLNYPKEIQAIQDNKNKATEEAETDDDYLAIDQEVKKSMLSLTKQALASNRAKRRKIDNLSGYAAGG